MYRIYNHIFTLSPSEVYDYLMLIHPMYIQIVPMGNLNIERHIDIALPEDTFSRSIFALIWFVDLNPQSSDPSRTDPIGSSVQRLVDTGCQQLYSRPKYFLFLQKSRSLNTSSQHELQHAFTTVPPVSLQSWPLGFPFSLIPSCMLASRAVCNFFVCVVSEIVQGCQ